MFWTLGSLPACCRLLLWAGRKRRAIWKCFYPTSLLITGYEILFFWVARMIMLGCYFMQGPRAGSEAQIGERLGSTRKN